MIPNNTVPSSLRDITLSQWIEYCALYGEALDQRLTELYEIPEGPIRELEMFEHILDRAYSLYAYFIGRDALDVKKDVSVGKIMQIYNEHFTKLFHVEQEDGDEEVEWKEAIWCLPPVELDSNTKITFGEFIDSKVQTQVVTTEKQNKWQLIRYIACIFYRMKDEPYREDMSRIGSARYELIGEMPMTEAHACARWFESFNDYLKNTFAVFQPAQGGSGENEYIAKHFETWGWVNMLISIAKTKMFDIASSGLNSIECARQASAYDVLVFASESKDYNEAMYADMRNQNGKL